MPNTHLEGRRWERTAESFLSRRGLRRLTRNYRSRFGEIDLVMMDGATLVFVEVRYRKSDRFGSGADSVTPAKQRRIVSTARHFLSCHPGLAGRPGRFDVVSIGHRSTGVEVEWIRDAFEAD